ncbi:MAG: magnesium/cobalt transporter CorA [Nanoarchaeota archaeon]
MPKRGRKVGLPPGTLIHIGRKSVDNLKISVIDYTEENLIEQEIAKIEDAFPLMDKDSRTWINISGLHDVSAIEAIGNHFNLHPLLLEDVVNTEQRPKLEDYDGYLFLVMKMLSFDDTKRKLITEQLSLIISKRFVITFQERPGDPFDAIRERLRTAKGKVRKLGTDYLAYTLIDAVVDNYFVILETFGDYVDDIREELLANPTVKSLETIHYLKREMILLRKSVWPVREVINSLTRSESGIIAKQTFVYLRDIYDHTIVIIDTLETNRDSISGMMDLYMSSVSNRMNEIMKVLTIIATIFIPLTFVAGVYGMNFRFMPELDWRYGYFMVWGVIILMAGLMVLYFKKKGWF